MHTHAELQLTHAHPNSHRSHTHSEFASDDLSLTLGIAIGVPLGAAYLAVQGGAMSPLSQP